MSNRASFLKLIAKADLLVSSTTSALRP
jgi:hypothetical protein